MRVADVDVLQKTGTAMEEEEELPLGPEEAVGVVSSSEEEEGQKTGESGRWRDAHWDVDATGVLAQDTGSVFMDLYLCVFRC